MRNMIQEGRLLLEGKDPVLATLKSAKKGQSVFLSFARQSKAGVGGKRFVVAGMKGGTPVLKGTGVTKSMVFHYKTNADPLKRRIVGAKTGKDAALGNGVKKAVVS